MSLIYHVGWCKYLSQDERKSNGQMVKSAIKATEQQGTLWYAKSVMDFWDAKYAGWIIKRIYQKAVAI